MHYRSVVVLGTAVEVTDETERLAPLEIISEPKATRVLRLPIEEASAKVRTGPPVGDEEDYDLRIQGFTAGDERCRR